MTDRYPPTAVAEPDRVPAPGPRPAPAAPAIHHAQVRWSDPDRLGHVNHARYLSYFEDARMELLAASPAGMPGDPAGDLGCIAARVAVDYLAAVDYRPGLMLRVRTAVARVGTSSWTLQQGMYDGDVEVARCECVLVGYDYAEGRSRPLTADERTFWQAYAV